MMRRVCVVVMMLLASVALGQVYDRLGAEDLRWGGEWTRTYSDGSTVTRTGLSPVNVCGYPFLATGDGATDDSRAIQTAIDSVYAWGGGTVYIPPGTYMLGSFQKAVSSHYASGGRNCLLLKSGVSIVGEGKDSVFKVDDSLGNYVSLFAQNSDADTLKNVRFADFAVDFNDANTVTLPDSAGTYPCFGFMVWTSDGVEWSGLHFKDVSSTSAIYQAGREDQNRNNVVAGCSFTGVGYGSTYYDSSIIRMDCERALIKDNVFVGDAGLRGAITAIEAHGRGVSILDNKIDSFQQMINLGGIAVHESEGCIVDGNYGYNVASGIRLWSHRDNVNDAAGAVESGLVGTVISNNTIVLGPFLPTIEHYRSGIWAGPFSGRYNLPYRGLKITDNTIRWVDGESFTGVLASEYSCGIYLGNWAGEVGPRQFHDVEVSNNYVEDTFFHGIRVRAKVLDGVNVSDNVVRSSGMADESLHSSFGWSWRMPVFVFSDSSATDVTVSRNHVFAGSGADSVGFMINASGTASGVMVRENSPSGYDVPYRIDSGIVSAVESGMQIMPTPSQPDTAGMRGLFWHSPADSTLYWYNGYSWKALH